MGLTPEWTEEARKEAPRTGHIAAIDALEVGLTSVSLGAGRLTQGDPIDPVVGIEIVAPRGSYVEEGAPIALVHQGKKPVEAMHLKRLQAAYTITDTPSAATPTILARVG